MAVAITRKQHNLESSNVIKIYFIFKGILVNKEKHDLNAISAKKIMNHVLNHVVLEVYVSK